MENLLKMADRMTCCFSDSPFKQWLVCEELLISYGQSVNWSVTKGIFWLDNKWSYYWLCTCTQVCVIHFDNIYSAY